MGKCFAPIWKRIRSLFKIKRNSTKSEDETIQLSKVPDLQPPEDEYEPNHVSAKDSRNDTAMVPYVNWKAQVPYICSNIVPGRMEKLRLKPNNAGFPKSLIDLSNTERLQLVLSKTLVENIELKLNELTQYHMIPVIKSEREKEPLQSSVIDNRCNCMALIPYVLWRAQVSIIHSSITQGGMEKLRIMPYSTGVPKFPIESSSIEERELILSNDLVENSQFKLNELSHMILTLQFGMGKEQQQNAEINNVCNYMAIIPYVPQAREQLVSSVPSTIAQGGMELSKSTLDTSGFSQLLKFSSDTGNINKNNIESKIDLIKDNVFNETVKSQKSNNQIFSILVTLKEMFEEDMNSGKSITINTTINDRKVFSQKEIRTENINKYCAGNNSKTTTGGHSSQPVIAALPQISHNRQTGYDDQQMSDRKLKIRSQQDLMKEAFSDSSVDKK